MSSERDETISVDQAELTERIRLGQLAPGQLFADRYEVQGLLGRGGMGAVYRVRDRKLDEVVALKLLTLDTEKAIERFEREVRLARRVTHPNVARTHDIGVHGAVHFLTMEYISGTPLDRTVADGEKLDAVRVAKIGEQIAAGLAAAHAAGVVHRDLKPGNVLIGDDGRVVITDFGIARAAYADLRTHDTGALVGTPHYMSPEQVVGSELDGRSDLYALGLMLYELATGRFPFEGENPLAVAVMRMHQPPTDPRTFEPIPDALADLILRCLARDRDQRIGSAEEVREALLALSLGQPLTAPPRAPTFGDASTPTSGSLYAPISPGRRALAILPFVYRGEAEHDYLGDGVAEELIDTLSRTKGLRVLALGATNRFRDDRDPARIGAELGADAIVDGTVQLSRDRVRISARLVETDSGVQRWNERYDGKFEDVFALQETMGRRIAESLRVEIDAAAHRRTAPQEAIELYLKARRHLRTDVFTGGADAAVEMLERCLELAPGFTPAVPALAMACVRAWWSRQEDRGANRGARARDMAVRAMREAPDNAETQLVSGMIAVQDGHYREAAQAFARTLEIAPTMPEAHWYLAQLQLETGRFKEGKRRLELALELDASLARGYLDLARVAALEGDFEAAHQHLVRIEEAASAPTMPVLVGRIRYGMWSGDIAAARRAMENIAKVPGEGPQLLLQLVKVGFGENRADEVRPILAQLPLWLENPRFTALVQQIMIEVFTFGGETALALEVLSECADGILVDLEWMRRCPVLGPLRASPIYAEALAKVERRAANVWER